MMEIDSGKIISLDSGKQPRFLVGLDASKSANPGVGDTFYATDTTLMYICFAAGVWTTQAFGSGFFRRFWQYLGTVVQGTWLWTANVNQSDIATLRGEGAGFWDNNSAANNDEYKWSNIYLAAGSYKITIAYVKSSGYGIAELLFGTTSLGTIDMYAAVTTYLNVSTITFTLTGSQTADLRFKVTGKNAASTAYIITFSRLELEKTG